MKMVIRYFFRTLRLILTPVMLISEKLSTPKSVARSPEDQAKVDQATSQLALYHFSACPFCIKVRKEMARLGLNLETRDAQHNTDHRAALEAGGGRIKVPCLLIQKGNGEQEWLYESNAIKGWLQSRFEPAKTA
ncbi:glutaredoxin family protein [Marinobacter caseinilyticus]|uniref:glutaredoxin family protein n=1 Tax=Marinobacter caseinilyticus TaxID=2692195 RepID=UPI0014080741|nr:glutaredoxin [Marinobacter caseinilyticus]